MASRAVFVSTRRYLSSTSTKDRVGTFVQRSKPTNEPNAVPKAPLTGETTVVPEEEAAIPHETQVKNGALAVSLLAFCVGVAWYSMNAVGQAGGDKDDPLAALKEEAAVAQVKQDREAQTSDEATSMLESFQSGEFDPDKYEELEAEQEAANRKSPWYKFW
jgi:hypothetical protein